MQRWLVLVVIFAIGLFGLFEAAGSSGGAGYGLGLALAAVAALLGFYVIGKWNRPLGSGLDIFPREPRNGWLMVATLGILALLSLFVAAREEAALYTACLVFAAICVVLAFLTIGKIFDASANSGTFQNGEQSG